MDKIDEIKELAERLRQKCNEAGICAYIWLQYSEDNLTFSGTDYGTGSALFMTSVIRLAKQRRDELILRGSSNA